ncbi:MAG TPA: hypothetical protein DCF73_12775 [Rhodobiaceae bacterium]|nr:hypothetical protein [Rhodobiaceae bacterium]
MNLELTLVILAASIACTGLLVWYEKRPTELGRIRLVPTTPLIFLSLMVAILMIVHVVNLMGYVTGR